MVLCRSSRIACGSHNDLMADSDNEATHKVKVADELLTRAKQTGARLNFIGDAALLNDIGAIRATLPYTI